MGLDTIWLSTLGDGLVRADRIVGIESHRSPELIGKPSRWLLDVTLAVSAGSGTSGEWDIGQLHRTLAQSDSELRTAPDELARVLHDLRRNGQAGIVRTVCRNGGLHFELDEFDEFDTK